MFIIDRFPLLCLPNKEINRIIWIMDLDGILGISLLSRKCYNLVISLKMKASFLRISIGTFVNIEICDQFRRFTVLKFYVEPHFFWEFGLYGWRKVLKTPPSIFMDLRCPKPNTWESERRNCWWTNNGFDVKDWLKHLQTLFNYWQIDAISFLHETYNIDDVMELCKNPICLTIRNRNCYFYNKLILQKFRPTKKLFIQPEVFEDSKIPQSILIRNYDNISIGGDSEMPTEMSLEDLLLINSKKITFIDLQLLPREINKFLKLWIKGSNPIMENLNIDFRDATDINDIMK